MKHVARSLRRKLSHDNLIMYGSQEDIDIIGIRFSEIIKNKVIVKPTTEYDIFEWIEDKKYDLASNNI